MEHSAHVATNMPRPFLSASSACHKVTVVSQTIYVKTSVVAEASLSRTSWLEEPEEGESERYSKKDRSCCLHQVNSHLMQRPTVVCRDGEIAKLIVLMDNFVNLIFMCVEPTACGH